MKNRSVKCSKCKKIVCFIPAEYQMEVDVTCCSCHRGKKPKKERATAAGNYSKTRKGIRPDVHPKYSFKSATEANFARILNYIGCRWQYEERAFTFDGYKTKPHVYVMDFQIISGGTKELPVGFYEIKGFMTSASRQKLRRYKNNYEEESANTTVVVYNKYKKKDIEFCQKLGYRVDAYDRLTEKYSKLIPTWE